METLGNPQAYILAGTLLIYNIPCKEWITKTTRTTRFVQHNVFKKFEHLMLETSKSTGLRALFKECWLH